ncbi:MAG: AI-2E family transporter, partial [Azonexus sp.]
MSTIRQDLTRTTLAVACIFVLIAASFWVLRPFLAATVWATMLVVATWPLLKSLEARFGGRRSPAVAVMTIGMLLLLILPLWGAIETIADHADQLTETAKKVAVSGVPQPPEWVATVPLVGEKLAANWRLVAEGGTAGLMSRAAPYVTGAAKWILGQAGSLGGMLVQFLLIVILSAIMYS